MQSKISVKELNNEIVFKVDGDFDNLLTIKYKNLITEILARKRCSLVYFDLSNVSFIDSSGIGLLLGRYKQIKEYKGQMIICGINHNIKKTIAISGLAMIIETYEDIYENIKGMVNVYE